MFPILSRKSRVIKKLSRHLITPHLASSNGIVRFFVERSSVPLFSLDSSIPMYAIISKDFSFTQQR
jgi:hypothetical protein